MFSPAPQGSKKTVDNFNPGQISMGPKSPDQVRVRQTLKDADAPRRNLSPRKQRRRSIDEYACPGAQAARQVTVRPQVYLSSMRATPWSDGTEATC
jgi:hypothetical protein